MEEENYPRKGRGSTGRTNLKPREEVNWDSSTFILMKMFVMGAICVSRCVCAMSLRPTRKKESLLW